MDAYFLPLYSEGEERGHELYSPELQENRNTWGKVISFLESHDECILSNLTGIRKPIHYDNDYTNSGLSSDNIINYFHNLTHAMPVAERFSLHYAENADKEEIVSEYMDRLEDDLEYHKRWAKVNAIAAAVDFFIPGPFDIFFLYRTYCHYKSIRGAQKALKFTHYVGEEELNEFETIMETAGSRKEAYTEAAKYAHDHDLEDLAVFYDRKAKENRFFRNIPGAIDKVTDTIFEYGKAAWDKIWSWGRGNNDDNDDKFESSLDFYNLEF